MLNDSSLVMTKPKPEQDTKVISMVYPPPNAEDIVQARFCSAMKRLILFTAKNNILFYRLEKKVTVLEKTVFPE